MKGKAENIYIVITALSLALSLVLIGLMAFHKGDSVQPPREDIKLNEVKIVENERKEIVISEDSIASALGSFLPEKFPKDCIKVNISANGTVYTGLLARRSQLTELARGLGAKERLLLKLLPEETEMGLKFFAESDSESGLLRFELRSFDVAGMELETDFIPDEIVQNIAQAVNKVLLESGYYYTKTELTDGAIKLLP